MKFSIFLLTICLSFILETYLVQSGLVSDFLHDAHEITHEVTNDVTSIVFPGNWREETQTPDTTSKNETENTSIKQLGEAAPEKSPEGSSGNKVPEPGTESSTVASQTASLSVSSAIIESQDTVTEAIMPTTTASSNGTREH
ncbi:hypothetical protein EVAR_68311_1 [Eumeta japonica]|uniref:Uncharacterized protein n=1 Tax=Eumeta variegata TaxID=151549 RepID=A0A4C2A8U6_EUMVA|nr:hypothetical protein EVAR_68311_1 [Eumeta japonica]